MHHLDKLLEHLLGNCEVGDHAVLHGANRFNVARDLAQHGFGFVAYSLNAFLTLRAAFMTNGYYRGLI